MYTSSVCQFTTLSSLSLPLKLMREYGVSEDRIQDQVQMMTDTCVLHALKHGDSFERRATSCTEYVLRCVNIPRMRDTTRATAPYSYPQHPQSHSSLFRCRQAEQVTLENLAAWDNSVPQALGERQIDRVRLHSNVRHVRMEGIDQHIIFLGYHC